MSIKPIAVSAAKISSIGCGAVIPNALYPDGISEIVELQRAYAGEYRFYIAGGLTNTLVKEVGERDAVLFTDNLKGIRVREDTITVRAGERTSHVADVARICGLSGMEELCCIPGSIGGAVSGNAGCFDTSMSDIVKSVKVFHLDDGQPEYLTADEIAFRYRYCNLRKNVDLICEVTLRLYPSNSHSVAKRMERVRAERREKLPLTKSLGSVFKRIDGVGCGYYLDRAGMKGTTVGGMQVSKKHAGIIVNVGGGTPDDYIKLADICAKTIQKEVGKRPEREVIVFGGDQ